MSQATTTERWSWWHVAALAVVFVAGIGIRIALLPAEGLKGDLDQFVLWVHGIAVNGLGNAYDQNLSFPAVMAYLWGVLAFLEPAFRTVTDSADPWIRTLMKIPASLADIGLALLMVYAFRARPFWAVVAAAIVMLHPAIIDVSAWWGQYESIYLLFAMAALVFALEGHDALAAVFLAICVMTKPQALPFVLPFAAWFWTHGGWREILRTGAIGLAVIVVLWLPFIPAGGPLDYIHNLAVYQSDIFPFLSLNAWNLWWLIQIAAVGGFASDQVAVIGPITLRYVGFALTGLAGARRGDPHRPRPEAQDVHPRARGIDADLVRVPDPDARALRVRRADVPVAAHPGATDPVALSRVRRRVHAEPLVRGAAGADLPDMAAVPRRPQPRSAAVAMIAITVRGVPLDELAGPRTNRPPRTIGSRSPAGTASL